MAKQKEKSNEEERRIVESPQSECINPEVVEAIKSLPTEKRNAVLKAIRQESSH